MRTKQVRPEPQEHEYELYISRETDNLKKKDYILFDFRTTKVFESFIYRINIDQVVIPEKHEIRFNIEGLSAPVLAMSSTGSASYKYKFYDFKNVEYCIRLIKQGKSKDTYKFKVSKSKITISRKPSKTFIKVFADTNQHT